MKVFLFPLPKASYQATLNKPFNIFEPRYVQMVHEAQKYKVPIALCYGESKEGEDSVLIEHEGLKSIKQIAGIGIPDILEKTKDGTMLILLQPAGKVQIHKTIDSDTPYLVASAEIITEFQTVMPDRMIELRKLELIFRNWAKTYFKDETEFKSLMDIAQDPIVLIGAIAEFVVDSPELKQMILELDDINHKVDILISWLE